MDVLKTAVSEACGPGNTVKTTGKHLHAKEMVTPEYSGQIETQIGDAEAHIPIGSRARFYIGEDVRVLCTNCVEEQQREINAGDGQNNVPFEQRIYFRSIVPPSTPEWNGL
eukprot:6202304-Amphidinium_carterae.1